MEPNAKRLAEFERGQINALLLQGISSRCIAKQREKSKTVTDSPLKFKDNYGKVKSEKEPISCDTVKKEKF